MKAVKKPIVVECYIAQKEEIIHTLEGDMKANVGDYVITGLRGEKYPCKPDIFKATYDILPDETPATMGIKDDTQFKKCSLLKEYKVEYSYK